MSVFAQIILGVSIVVVLLTIISMSRNSLLARMGFRNILRRPGTTVLVILGSLVGTALITGSMVIGDSFARTSEVAIEKSLGEIDAIVSSRAGEFFREEGEGKNLKRVRKILKKDKNIDDVAYLNISNFPIQKVNTKDLEIGFAEDVKTLDLGPLEPNVVFLAGNWDMLGEFGSNPDLNTPIESPQAGEVILSSTIADKIKADVGDQILLLAYPRPIVLEVRDIESVRGVPGYHPSNVPGSAILSETDMHLLLGTEDGRYNSILISSVGSLMLDDYDPSKFTNMITGKLLDIGYLESDFVVTEAKDALIQRIQGGGISDTFLIVSVFGIIAGGLLIVNIYSMLAEERKSEMGMLRAVALKRGELVKTFTYEGFFYSILSSFAGIGVGIGIGYILIMIITVILNTFLSQFGIEATIYFGVTPVTLVIAFGAGFLVTYVTVVLSSFIISKVNIVSAIRGTEPEIKKRKIAFRIIFLLLKLMMVMQGLSLFVKADTIQDQIRSAMGEDLVVDGYFRYGGFVLGVLFLGMFLHQLFDMVLSPHIRQILSRAVFSLAGIAIFTYTLYTTVADSYKEIYESSPVFFFVTGLAMVIAVSIFVAYNVEFAIGVSRLLLAPFRGFISVVRIGLRYPSEKRGRLGITLTMFALIVFMVVFISVTRASMDTLFANIGKSFLGGYDMRITLQADDPKDETIDLLTKNNSVLEVAEVYQFRAEFPGEKLKAPPEAMSGQDTGSGQMFGAVSPEGIYSDALVAVDSVFLTDVELEVAKTAKGIEPEDLWHQLDLRTDAAVLGPEYDVSEELKEFISMPEWKVGDKIKFKYPGTEIVVEKEIIGRVVGRGQTNFQLGNILLNLDGVERDLSSSSMGNRFIKTDQLLLRFGQDVRVGEEASDLKEDLARLNIINVFVADEFVALFQTFLNQFIYLLQGFLAFGLVVGLAGLGVIMARSVTERRQQIGMLRSLGFTRGMILGSFMLEASFIGLLGVGIGVVTGSIAGLAYMNELAGEVESLEAIYPAVEVVGLVGVVYLGTVLFSIFPAISASRLEPVEATNYPE